MAAAAQRGLHKNNVTFSICTAAAPGLAARTRPRISSPYAVNAVHPRLRGLDVKPQMHRAKRHHLQVMHHVT